MTSTACGQRQINCSSSTTAIQTVNIGSSPVTPKSDTRNLGFMLDNRVYMAKHVSNVCRCAVTSLYKICQIWKYLDLKTTERLIHAFVTSRLDYCNFLLYGLPQYELSKLQRIQNSSARMKSRKRDNVESILQEFLVSSIVYKTLFDSVFYYNYNALGQPLFYSILVVVSVWSELPVQV